VNLKLPDDMSSSQDIKALITEIRKYIKWYAQNSVKSRVSGSKTPPPMVVSQATASLINDLAKLKPLNQASLDELIAWLEAILESSPRITITLAAPPGTKLKTTLIDWCRTNLSPGILVDFRFNSTLLGGMVVRLGSRVYDWSFRRQILASRAHFPEVLRRV